MPASMIALSGLKPVVPLFMAVGTAVTGGVWLGVHNMRTHNEVVVNKRDQLQFAHQDQHNLMNHSARLRHWNQMRGPTQYFTPFEEHIASTNQTKQQLYEIQPQQLQQQTKSDYVPIQM